MGLPGTLRAARPAGCPRHCQAGWVDASCYGRENGLTTYKVGSFVGSPSKNSINRTLSKALIRLAPPQLEFEKISIADLPLYNHHFDPDYPPEGAR